MRLDRGAMAGGRVTRAGSGPFDALLVSRLDFDVLVLDIPPIPHRELEGLVRYKLRSRYPGDPRQTSFDYRLVHRGKVRRAIVFVARTSTVEAYRAVAGRRPLVAPCQLVDRRVPRRGVFHAWIGDGRWAEVLEYRDGVLETSRVVRRGTGDWPAGGDDTISLPLASLQLRRDGLKGLFPTPGPGPTVPAGVRMTLLAATILVLGVLVLFRFARREEARVDRLQAIARSMEQEALASHALRQEVNALLLERDWLDASVPQDRYRLLAELSAVLVDAARLRAIELRDDRFQLEATGGDPLALMEALEARDGFDGLQLSQVVPDAASGTERFAISGVFHGR
jgi:hypothetical protein